MSQTLQFVDFGRDAFATKVVVLKVKDFESLGHAELVDVGNLGRIEVEALEGGGLTDLLELHVHSIVADVEFSERFEAEQDRGDRPRELVRRQIDLGHHIGTTLHVLALAVDTVPLADGNPVIHPVGIIGPIISARSLIEQSQNLSISIHPSMTRYALDATVKFCCIRKRTRQARHLRPGLPSVIIEKIGWTRDRIATAPSHLSSHPVGFGAQRLRQFLEFIPSGVQSELFEFLEEVRDGTDQFVQREIDLDDRGAIDRGEELVGDFAGERVGPQVQFPQIGKSVEGWKWTLKSPILLGGGLGGERTSNARGGFARLPLQRNDLQFAQLINLGGELSPQIIFAQGQDDQFLQVADLCGYSAADGVMEQE
mmetsp:Transcript_33965/g.101398  ORF Transcript_33965/g.101398 Transcript_33965/m.101398 type:complete len:369 (+) Transcript_33965:1530-2636(+)